jgi:O-antigen/teichoic acid export membrane protein
VYASLSMMGSKGVAVLISLISVPLTYNYLSDERFGVMMTIVSIVTAINFVDLGLGFGLQNRWGEICLDSTGIKAKESVSSVFFFLLFIALVLIIAGIVLYFSESAYTIFKLKENGQEIKSEINNSILVLIAVTSFSIPFSIVQKIQNGRQESYKVNLWNTAASIFSIFLLFIFTRSNLKIPFIIFALYGTNSIFIFFNFINEFFLKSKNNLISYQFFNFGSLKYLIKDGGAYMINQFSAIFINTSNNLFLVTYHSPAVIAVFNIGLRLASLFSVPVESISPFFMPALNDAFLENDIYWIKKTLKWYMLVVVIYSIFSLIIFIFFGDFITEVWIGKENFFSKDILISFALLAFLTNLTYFASSTIMTNKYLFLTFYFYPITVFVVTAVRFFTVPSYGIIGLIYPQIIFQFFLYIMPIFLLLKKNKFI